MRIIRSLKAWNEVRQSLAAESTIGFVPTMGNLHRGHASLLERARQENDLVVLSIFVNQTQFNQAQDYQRYPRTEDNDIAIAQTMAVDYVWLPTYEELYPDDYAYKISEKDYQQLMLVRGMVDAFFMNMEIIGCETIRESSGLPLSSRNNLLSIEERQQADIFPKIFHSDLSCDEIKLQLVQAGFGVDYIEEHDGRRFAAVKLGNVRLIDNIQIPLTENC